MLKLYHNPSCPKCVAALEYMQKRGIKVQAIQYFRSPLSETELGAILLKMDKEPREIIRVNEPVYIQRFKDQTFTEREWIRILIQNPQIIQRPIVVSKYKALIADPPERIEELLRID